MPTNLQVTDFTKKCLASHLSCKREKYFNLKITKDKSIYYTNFRNKKKNNMPPRNKGKWEKEKNLSNFSLFNHNIKIMIKKRGRSLWTTIQKQKTLKK